MDENEPQRSGPGGVIRLPGFRLPFPSEIHPDTDSVIAHTCEWTLTTGLVPDATGVERLRRGGIMTAGPRLAPRATFNAAGLISDWTVWLIVLDDAFDEGPLGAQPELARAAIEDVTAAFAGGAHAAGGVPGMAGVSAAAASLGRRFTALSPDPAWLTRFRDHAEAHIWSKVSEAEHRAAAGVLDVPSYVALRRITSAAYTYAELAGLAEQAPVTGEVRESAAWRQMLDAAADVWLGIQDICSAAKEVTSGDTLNLAAVMARSAGTSLQQGIDDAYQWTCRRAADFEDRRAKLAGDTAAGRYLAALERLLGGHLTWNSKDNPRYPQTVPTA